MGSSRKKSYLPPMYSSLRETPLPRKFVPPGMATSNLRSNTATILVWKQKNWKNPIIKALKYRGQESFKDFIFWHKKEIWKSRKANRSTAGDLSPYFNLPLLTCQRLNPQVSISTIVNKRSINYHLSPSW